MASTYTPNKGFERPAHNDYINDWELPVNADFTTIDTCFGGFQVLNPTGLSGVVVLTSSIAAGPPLTETAQWQPPNIIVGASQTTQATLTANVNYQFPSGIGGRWTIFNNTNGAFTVTFSSGGGGLSRVIPQGVRTTIVCDGTNVVGDFNGSVASFTTPELVLSGSTTGFVALEAPATSGSQIFTLPAADGTGGQVLSTNGSGQWGWISSAGGTFSGGTTGLLPNSPTTNAVLSGVLGVANGGSGAGTAFTAGSVLFSGASGIYSQNNANLFWDNTNDRLGIGTAAPSYPLDIVTNSNSITSIGRAYNQSGGSSAGSEFIVQTGTTIAAIQTNNAGGYVGTASNNGFTIITNGLPAMTFSTGQVAALTNPLPVTSGGTGVTTSTGTGANVLNNAPSFTGGITVAGGIAGNASSATVASSLTPGGTIGITGDLTYTSPTFTGATVSAAGTLATVNGNVGSFTNASITVNAKGLITAASSGSAPYVPTYAEFQEQQASGTPSGNTTILGATWTQRVLNTTMANTIAGASLTSNQITLPAGTYQIRAFSSSAGNGTTGRSAIRLRNITDSTTPIVGANTANPANSTINATPQLSGTITLAASKVLELDVYSTTTGSGGNAITSGEAEVYTDVQIFKVA